MRSLIPTLMRGTVLAVLVAAVCALWPVFGADPDLSSPRSAFDTFLRAGELVRLGLGAPRGAAHRR